MKFNQRVKKLIQLVSICICFITTHGQASAMITNLHNINYSHKSEIEKTIFDLTKNKEDAYSLSVTLLASAQQGDELIYYQILKNMNVKLNSMKDDALKAWILGRILFAASSIHDVDTANHIKLQLLKLLDSINISSIAPTDVNYAMYTWAYGYFVALNTDAYFKKRDQMMQYIANMENAARQSTTNHDLLSNTVWAEIMALQAAANANDEVTYNHILLQMKSITHQQTISEALKTALTITDTSSDAPAWGMSIVTLSAATIKDKKLYHELNQPLMRTIYASIKWSQKPNQTPANQWKANADATLGKLNMLLSTLR
jgi:hypothetical protein